MRKILITLLIGCAAVLLVNYIACRFSYRADLTQDQRYTLSKNTLDFINATDDPIVIDVFLDGTLPGEFRKLKSETQQLLEEMAAQSGGALTYNFLDPLADLSQSEADQVTQQLAQSGIKPALATIQESGKNTNTVVFPWAMIIYNGKTAAVPLLKTVARSSMEERVNSSIQQLEYQLADGLRKVLTDKSKTIAIMRDSGELSDKQLYDLRVTLQQYYRIAPYGIEFLNDSIAAAPGQVLDNLNKFDLVIEAKPTLAWSETKKYILDQYLMQGGNLLLAVDPIIMENDSLANPESRAYPLPRDLLIDEMLFKYGLRLNNGLIKDIKNGPLALATGQGRNTQYEAFTWPYYPIASSTSDHPIVTNLEDVKFEYAGSIDTLKNGITKTVLLNSSKQSKVLTLPAAISLSEIDEELDINDYKDGEQPLAVLATGKFTSAYKNRIKPFNYTNHIDQSTTVGNILLISDGDVLKNQIDRGRPQELGYDIRTGALYGNKEFLVNSVNYMLDDNNLVALRNKEVVIPFLNTERVYDERFKWQLINVLAPIILLGLIGFIMISLRKRRYAG